MVSTRLLISKSSSTGTNTLVTVPRAPITISMISIFLLYSLFNSLTKVEILISFFTFFKFYSVVSRDSKVHNSASSLFFLLIISRSDRLIEIWWSVCFLKCLRSLFVAFSRTDTGVYIYHLFVWSNFNFLHNSQWITLATQSCLVLYSFCASLLHSLIMWLIVSSLLEHNLHLLFCYVYFHV